MGRPVELRSPGLLRWLFADAGIGTNEAARRLGVSHQRLGRAMRDECVPRYHLRRSIAALLDVEPELIWRARPRKKRRR